MVYEEPKRWSDHLPPRVMGITDIKADLNSNNTILIVYGTETVVPVEIAVRSARLALASKVLHPEGRKHDIEALEERRQKAEEKWQTYQNQISMAYNKKLKPCTLKVGDLVHKAAGHIQKGTSASKFAPKWE